MFITLLLVSFLATYFTTIILNTSKSIKENILTSVLLFSVIIVFSTEILSLFHGIGFTEIISFWVLISILGWGFALKNKQIVHNHISSFKSNVFTSVNQLSIYYKITLLSIIALLILIFFQGVIYPPNNWDSMTYHLPRIAHWIQNHSVENYTTHITRQLYSPLYSEYLDLHTHILSHSDIFSNSIQFFFLILTVIAVLVVLNEFNVSKLILFISAILCLTLPEGLLQASSTQNDIVHSFFTVVSIYFAIKAYKTFEKKHFILFGIAISLCLLTKVIAYIYAPFIVLIFAFFALLKMIKEKKYPILKYSIYFILPIILINFGHSFRNYQFSGNIIGTDHEHEKGMVFEKTSPKIILSTCLKNISLHSDPIFIGNLGNVLVEKAHILINMDINEPGTNVFDMKFEANNNWQFHEDVQPNFIHISLFFCCILISFVFLLKNRKIDPLGLTFLILISTQFILFCAYLCWEPWNTRVHSPLFFEIIIFIAIILNKLSVKLINISMYLLFPVLIGYGYYSSLHNYIRPYFYKSGLNSKIKITDPRFKKYFANQIQLYPEYKSFQKFILNKNPAVVGLITHIDGWEYPLIVNEFKNSNLKIHHINVTNLTDKLEEKNKKLDYIVSTHIVDSILVYNHTKFKLTTPRNKHVFIYTKL